MIHSYAEVFSLGHRAIENLFLDEVEITEKIDGSQISWQVTDGFLQVRSKGKEMIPGYVENMFNKAVETIKEIAPLLKNGWTYRGEFLQKPHHNALAYNRVPKGNIILFNIDRGEEDYLDYAVMCLEARRIGLEVVPLLYRGIVNNLEMLKSFLEKESILGGQKIEGVVAKNYQRFGKDKKILAGKLVSEEFKEVHSKEWRKQNPTKGDLIQNLIMTYRTEARWRKAVQRLKEDGVLTNSPQDIGGLMEEVQRDIEKECHEEIAEALYKTAIKHIKRGVTAGLPLWYKQELAKSQFTNSLNQS
jgi:hypothetical protein